MSGLKIAMAQANGAATTRGVVEVELGGQVYELTPSWQALDEIETALGTGVGLLLRKVLTGSTELSFHEQAVIIRAGIRATGAAQGSDDRGASLDRVKAMLFDAGAYSQAVAVGGFIAAAVNGGRLIEAGPGKETAETEAAGSLSAGSSD